MIFSRHFVEKVRHFSCIGPALRYQQNYDLLRPLLSAVAPQPPRRNKGDQQLNWTSRSKKKESYDKSDKTDDESFLLLNRCYSFVLSRISADHILEFSVIEEKTTNDWMTSWARSSFVVEEAK